MRALLLLSLMLAGGAVGVQAQSFNIGKELQAARALAASAGAEDWPGYGRAPFEVLLLEPDRELLLCRPSIPAASPPPGGMRRPDAFAMCASGANFPWDCWPPCRRSANRPRS